MRKIKKSPILIFLVVLVALYVVIYIIPTVTGALRSSYTTEYGELQTYDKVDGYLVKNEQVYFAGNGGSANRYMSEGKLIRKGATVMAVSGSSEAKEKSKFDDIRTAIGDKGVSTTTYTTLAEGIVSYAADGYEAKLTPATMEKKNYDYYKSLKNDSLVDLTRTSISKGDPVFKIVDRSGWYIVCYVPVSHKSRYVTGDKITLKLDDSTSIYGNVYRVTRESGKAKVIFKTDYYYKKFATERVVSVKAITSDAMGLLIYNSSITKKGGHKGVYVKQKAGGYKFTRIQVISTDGKKSAIKQSYFYDAKGNSISSVKSYDEILRRAK